jgi:uncharacterized protein YegJ (DUF2314 family)
MPAVLLVICGGEGCARQSSPRDAEAPAARADEGGTEPRNDWREIDASPQVALDADADDEALAAAIARARETAEAARLAWHAKPPTDRSGWAIRWAAPTADGGLEYLWVEPINWSRHRIEGRLANPPQRELACGKGLDDLVGFPVEQLADWIAPPGEGLSGAASEENGAGAALAGGFTVRLMEQRHGCTTPPSGAGGSS